MKRTSTNAHVATYRFSPNVPARIWSELASQVRETVLGARAEINGRRAGAEFPNGVGCSTLDCFLTTATVETLGLPDDCWELSTLRCFRDGPMRANQTWQALVDEYDAIAPGIVQAISVRPDAHIIWARTYITDILPSALAASLGMNSAAVWLYRRMVKRLSRIGSE